MIELNDVSRSFGDKRVLDGITLQIENGITFLVGPSGAGKSTLAGIIGGIDRNFTGTVRIDGRAVSERSEAESYHALNTSIGFIWQNFHLIPSRTVSQNVALPLEIANDADEKTTLRALRSVGIENLAQQHVRSLSGGQRQRTAIARELAKSPAVIIADEPTSALDPQSAQDCMDSLRDVARGRCVIVVTHDESLIRPTDGLIRLSKGRVTESRAPKTSGTRSKRAARLPFRGTGIAGAARLALTSARHGIARCLTVIACALIVSTLAAPVLHGALSHKTDDALANIYQSYGDNALDISIVRSFMGAGGSQDKSAGPNVDVDQDTSGLFKRYADDPRVSGIYAMQTYDEIEVEIDGKTLHPQSSGSAPAFGRLVAGSAPAPNSNDVVVPQSVAKNLGIKNEDIIGKSIKFHASVTTWNGNDPIWKPVETTAKICGVVDTTMKMAYEGQSYEFELEDAFFFSPKTTMDMRKQAGLSSEPDFTIRPTSPKAMIEIKDELSAQGVVPLGNFELVENTVRLQEGTQSQSQTASAAVLAAAAALCLAVFAGVAWARKREIAIMRICGCSRVDMTLTLAFEGLFVAAGAGIASFAAGTILGGNAATWAIVACAGSAFAYLIQIATAALSNPFSVLKRARR